MNDTLEIKMRPSRRMPMSPREEDLMQQHLRDENLPEAVSYVTTVPGPAGAGVAFVAEAAIACRCSIVPMSDIALLPCKFSPGNPTYICSARKDCGRRVLNVS